MSLNSENYSLKSGSSAFYGGANVQLGNISYVTNSAELLKDGKVFKKVSLNDINPFLVLENDYNKKRTMLKTEYIEKSEKAHNGLKNYFKFKDISYDFKKQANKILGNESFNQLNKKNQALYNEAMNNYQYNRKLAFKYETIFQINNRSAMMSNDEMRKLNNQCSILEVFKRNYSGS